MQLGNLLTRLSGSLAKIDIRGITADSRDVQPGFLFAALPGYKTDGRRFIAEAVARGAVAILAPEGSEAPVPLLASADPRRELALIAAAFYEKQPPTILAVTGTSGKTSTAWFAHGLLNSTGRRAGYLGTLGLIAPGSSNRRTLTTPDPVLLHQCLAETARAGATHFVLEASSHGLEQRRLDGVRLTAAAFTNLQRDHLDYHRTMADYFAAKARLFLELLPEGGGAVLRAGDEWSQILQDRLTLRGQTYLTYGEPGADLTVAACTPIPDGQALTLFILGQKVEVVFPALGDFQAENLLAALGLVLTAGVTIDSALAAVATLRPVPGRMEIIGKAAGGLVIVDYAHKPAALEAVLTSVRRRMPRGAKLHLVFGCGGDRDRGKRPMMGRIASRLADRAIVTDDNPRSEDPAAIRRSILAGCDGGAELLEIDDRGEAIVQAIAALAREDVLILAGKGHETGQILATGPLAFDDRERAAKAIAAQGGQVTWAHAS